jgi:formylglycine-generating enzyme required for sulfatase activity
MSGRAFKSPYPWGDGTSADVRCQDAVFARGNQQTLTDYCSDVGWGPTEVDAIERSGGLDVSALLRIVNLAGNVGELVRERFAPLGSNCWAQASIELPTCTANDASMMRALRGGAWNSTRDSLFATNRDRIGTRSTGVGFRCVRPGGAP